MIVGLLVLTTTSQFVLEGFEVEDTVVFGKDDLPKGEPEVVENFRTETKHADVRNNMIDWDEVFRIFVPDGKETELEIKFQLI